MVTAALDHVPAPAPLLEQLAPGGASCCPWAPLQELTVLTKTEHGLERHTVLPVRFVPMTGAAEGKR